MCGSERSVQLQYHRLEKNLTKGSPLRLIVLFSIPLLLGNFIQQLYNVVDMFIVGRTLGASALAAVGCTGSILFLIIGFAFSATAGFGIVTSQFYGANDLDGVRKSFCTSLVCSMITGVFLTAVCVTFIDDLLLVMQTPDEIYADTRRYLIIIFYGMLPLLFSNVLSNTILALGDSKTPLFFLIIACGLNVTLDYVFILWFGWGVAGAAAATVIAQLTSGILCVFYIIYKQPLLILRRRDWHLRWKDLSRSMKVGLPMGFQSSIIALGCVIVQTYLNKLGPVPVAAYSISNKIDMFACMPLMSFGIAMATYVGQNYGAGKFDRIRDGVRQCCRLSLAFSIAAAGINILFCKQFVRAFLGGGEPVVEELSQVYMSMNATQYWILSLLFIYRYSLQGLGKSFVPTVAGVMELVMRFLAAILLVEPLGFCGVSMANPLAWIGSALPLWIAYTWFIRHAPAPGSFMDGRMAPREV